MRLLLLHLYQLDYIFELHSSKSKRQSKMYQVHLFNKYALNTHNVLGILDGTKATRRPADTKPVLMRLPV